MVDKKYKSRIMVFIDNSNIFKRLKDLNKVDKKTWPKKYNPYELAKKLTGDRELVGIKFYCAPPPSYLQTQGQKDQSIYWSQIDYYEAVKALPLVELKQGYLSGSRSNLVEKNVDTQIVADMILLANQNQYDTAILCSNDGDYISGVLGAKSLGKKVEVMAFKGMASLNLMAEADLTRRARPIFFQELNCENEKLRRHSITDKSD
jgi:uncharacterized LabA/DUF88 family protein